MKKIVSYLLLFLFTVLFASETIEYYLMGIKEKSHASVGIQQLEEDTEGEEESRKENDDELKFNDDFLIEKIFLTSFYNSNHYIFDLNLHYQSSDYSALVYSPPDLI